MSPLHGSGAAVLTLRMRGGCHDLPMRSRLRRAINRRSHSISPLHTSHFAYQISSSHFHLFLISFSIVNSSHHCLS